MATPARQRTKRVFNDITYESVSDSPRARRRDNNDDVQEVRPLVDMRMKLTPTNMGMHIFTSTAKVIFFLQHLGLLARARRCRAHPDVPMRLTENAGKIDEWVWVCAAPNCKKEVSVRKNS